jgi:hypothetical protein
VNNNVFNRVALKEKCRNSHGPLLAAGPVMAKSEAKQQQQVKKQHNQRKCQQGKGMNGGTGTRFHGK